MLKQNILPTLILTNFGNKICYIFYWYLIELLINFVTNYYYYYYYYYFVFSLCYFGNKNFGYPLYLTYIILVINSITACKRIMLR